MRVSSLGVARPDPIDRNAIVTVNTYINLNLAPHALTERWSQTIASGKKAQISTMQISVLRCTVATAVSLAYAQISANTLGSNDPIAIAWSENNTVGVGDNQIVGVAGTYPPGTIIKGYTVDVSTGGSMRYNVGATVMAYDA